MPANSSGLALPPKCIDQRPLSGHFPLIGRSLRAVQRCPASNPPASLGTGGHVGFVPTRDPYPPLSVSMVAVVMMGRSIRLLVPRQQQRPRIALWDNSSVDGLQRPPEPKSHAVLPLPWHQHNTIHEFRQRSGTAMSSFTQAATVALSERGEMNDEERRRGMRRQEARADTYLRPRGRPPMGAGIA